jgi:hypothetical protein
MIDNSVKLDCFSNIEKRSLNGKCKRLDLIANVKNKEKVNTISLQAIYDSIEEKELFDTLVT